MFLQGYVEERNRDYERYAWRRCCVVPSLESYFHRPALALWTIPNDHIDLGGYSACLKTLHSVLGHNQHKPYLSQRISLSLELATSLSSLQTGHWLYRGIHSGNVIFACEEERIDLERPILLVVEYSRPSIYAVAAFGTHNARWDLFRWPSLQNEPPRVGASSKNTMYTVSAWYSSRLHIENLYAK